MFLRFHVPITHSHVFDTEHESGSCPSREWWALNCRVKCASRHYDVSKFVSKYVATQFVGHSHYIQDSIYSLQKKKKKDNIYNDNIKKIKIEDHANGYS